MAERYAILKGTDKDAALGSLGEWALEDNGLTKIFKFPSFVKAVSFVTAVAIESEKMNHHPRITITYNKVLIDGLCTHDAGGEITTLDVELAQRISGLVNSD